MMRPPGHLRRRLEGRHPAHSPARRSMTTTGSCTTSPRIGPSAGTSPRDAREAGGAGRPLVGRGRGARGAAHSTTAPSSSSAPASATGRRTRQGPALHLLPADDAAAGPGGARRSAAASWDLLGHDRPSRRRRRGAVRVGHARTRGLSLVRPGRPPRLRLQLLRRPPDRRPRTARCPRVTRSSGSSSAARQTGPGHARHRRRRGAALGRDPVRHVHDVEHRPERRVRPRLAGQRALPASSRSRAECTGSTSSWWPRTAGAIPGSPRPRRGARCRGNRPDCRPVGAQVASTGGRPPGLVSPP